MRRDKAYYKSEYEDQFRRAEQLLEDGEILRLKLESSKKLPLENELILSGLKTKHAEENKQLIGYFKDAMETIKYLAKALGDQKQ